MRAKQHTVVYPIETNWLKGKLFSKGGEWMSARLQELGFKVKEVSTLNYRITGLFKYGVCTFFLCLSAFYLLPISLWFIPVPILLFYFVEIHLLFLFPLLITKGKNIYIKSIKITSAKNPLQGLITVLFISIYMIIGLLDIKRPLYNWYIGCLAVLIWFKDDAKLRF